MGPIIQLGMGLATFELRSIREAMVSLLAGVAFQESSKKLAHQPVADGFSRWDATVHLALVHEGRPVLGLIVLPELQELWFGVLHPSTTGGASGVAWCEGPDGYSQPPRLSSLEQAGELVLVASRSHRDNRLEQLLEALPIGPSRAMGSVGGKVATILRGETDVYISLSGKSAPKDWDMAAPEAVLRAAGGAFSHADGQPLAYNRGDGLQAGCLIASHGLAHPLLCERATAAMATIDPGFAV